MRKARFFQIGEVAAGRLANEPVEQKFYYVSLYDHCIGTAFRQINGINFIISNGFLASHAYNLALTLTWRQEDSEAARLATLRHNYKKFFAECVLHTKNRLIGRGLLLETLLYEQDLMAPMFAVARRDPQWDQKARDIARLMTDLPAHHELAHYFKSRSGDKFREVERSLFSGHAIPVLAAAEQQYGGPFAEEVCCDAFAAYNAVSGLQGSASEHDLTSQARMVALGFLLFADLVSLEKSAQATAKANVEEDGVIDLTSEKRPKQPFTFVRGRSVDHDVRAGCIIDLLGRFLHGRDQTLFGDDGPFPFPASRKAELRKAFETFADEAEPLDNGLTGTNNHRRGLAQLVAESMHGDDRAAEFLLWRSKQFSVGGAPIDP
jgi:hypothetical protein